MKSLLLIGVAGFSGGAMAESFDYTKYAEVLKAYVDDDGGVNYASLKQNRSGLDAFVESLGGIDAQDFEAWSEDSKVAFWINAYNSITLKRIIDHYPIKPGGIVDRVRFPHNSIRQIDGVWTKLTSKVIGQERTLDAIEHDELRSKFDEPRIHVALVCAAKSCPPLRNEPFTTETLNAQLDDQTRKFLQREESFRIDRAKAKVYLSSIFTWFGKDFQTKFSPKTGFDDHKPDEAAVLNFISAYLKDDAREYLATAKFKIAFVDYDWTLNEQP